MTVDEQIKQAYRALEICCSRYQTERINPAFVQTFREALLSCEREITRLRLELDQANGNSMWDIDA